MHLTTSGRQSANVQILTALFYTNSWWGMSQNSIAQPHRLPEFQTGCMRTDDIQMHVQGAMVWAQGHPSMSNLGTKYRDISDRRCKSKRQAPFLCSATRLVAKVGAPASNAGRLLYADSVSNSRRRVHCAHLREVGRMKSHQNSQKGSEYGVV